MKKVIVNINIEIPTKAKTEEEAITEAENYELPGEYVEDSFEIVKVIEEENPSKCPKCGTETKRELISNPDYHSACPKCDEDFYYFELKNNS